MAQGLQRAGVRARGFRHRRYDRRPIETGRLAVFGAGDTIDLQADARQDSNKPNLEVIVLGGQPIGGNWPGTARS
ncbi:hypothetical protein GTZ85_12065 [Streptomyces sp. SID5474]|nr:hypothetical protein [Streptomyces sp. SID5474]